ncbi:hypothetical protein [Methylomonas sp. AM2-LC]|uniref:hypothetical protein n=1 Tax=Methylomonas sp. AM2-LC TaxID=3153301 RepID=UPI003264BDEA
MKKVSTITNRTQALLDIFSDNGAETLNEITRNFAAVVDKALSSPRYQKPPYNTAPSADIKSSSH